MVCGELIIHEKGGQCSFCCRFPIESRFLKDFGIKKRVVFDTTVDYIGGYDMVFFVEIPFILIIFVLLGLVGLGYNFISNIYAIIFVLSVVAFAILGIYMSIKQLVFAISKGKWIGVLLCVLSFFSGIFFPDYVYSCLVTITGSLEKGLLLSLLFSGILFGVYAFIGAIAKVDAPDEKKWNTLIGIILTASLAIFAFGIGAGGYGTLKKDILAQPEASNQTEKYIVKDIVFPRFDEIKYTFKNDSHYTTVKFPYQLGFSFYPFAFFKQGETVYVLPDYISKGLYSSERMQCVGIAAYDENYEDCLLVCTENQKVLGYVPVKYLQPVE